MIMAIKAEMRLIQPAAIKIRLCTLSSPLVLNAKILYLDAAIYLLTAYKGSTGFATICLDNSHAYLSIRAGNSLWRDSDGHRGGVFADRAKFERHGVIDKLHHDSQYRAG